MKKFLSVSLLFIIASLLSLCTRKNLIEVTQTSFKDEVATQENLKFTFNRPMVGDSLLNRWDSTTYLNFTPAVAGKFKWVSPTEVIFSPFQGFQPSTDYQASLNPQLSKLLGNKVPVNAANVLKFHSTYLRLEGADVFWSQDERRTNQLRVNLNFNYNIFPASIDKLISAQVDGKAIPAIKVLNREPSQTAEILIEEAGGFDFNGKTIDLEIAAGLKCAESDFVSKKIISYKVLVPNRNRLSIEKVLPEYENNEPLIRVKTNQSVSLTEVTKNLKISPAIIYEVQSTDYGFVVKGGFSPRTNYTVKLNNNLQSVFGVRLSEDFEQNITFGEMSPMIQFVTEKGLYLSNQGNKNIGIRINNVPKVHLKVYKIYESNLLHFLRHRNMYDNMSDYNLREWEQYGDVVFDKEYTTKMMPIVNDFRVLNLDFDQLNSQKGVYAIHLSSTESQWLNASKMISISDIGFIAKETKDDILIFANSLISAKPMVGTKINLISQSNQTLASLSTNAEGVAVFSDIKRKFPNAEVKLITAYNGNDFNYLYFSQSEVDKSSFETGGMTENTSGYQAFLYGERDLYRPGETINLNVIVRNRQWKPAGNIPIKVKFKLPNGRDLSILKGNLSNQGSYNPSLKLPQSAMTGTYYAEVYTATDVLLNSMPISVEEFMPDRIKVRLKLTESDYETDVKTKINNGDSVRVLVSAVNLFGPPASNRNYQVNFSLDRKALNPKAYSQYDFEVKTPKQSDENNNYLNLISKNTEGVTDEKGLGKESFQVPREYENLGLLQGNIYATVFDETGRSVSRSVNFNVFTQNTFLGIGETDWYVGTNRILPINLIALNPMEIPISAAAKVQVVRYKWQTVLEKSYGDNYQYVSKRKEELVLEQNINIPLGGTAFNFTPTLSGDYEVKLMLPNAQTYVSRRFYAYGYGSENPAFEVDKDGKIEIKLDKENYKLGESAKVLFTAPFNGRMLVTVERDKIFEHFYLNVENKSASFNLNLKGEHLPNVYVTATLIKPISDGAIPLTVAHGFQSVAVEDADSRLNLSIEAVEKTESKQKQTIKVRTNRAESDIEVTLAVVDEGILQLKNYDTPNPHDYFFQKRGLQVDSYDLYPQLFPEISINKSLVGGDGGGLDARANPMVNNRIKLVRFWSGVLKTNAAGEVSHTIDIPQFSGSLRIMAVAYKDGRFGSAQKNMTVADPIVVSTGLPRFLSPGDQVTIPVTVTNTTGNMANAQILLQTTDNLPIVGNGTQTIDIKPNNEGQVKFQIRAKEVIDSAKVKIQVIALGRTFGEELSINIRPTVGLVKAFGGGSIEGGMNQSLTLPNDLYPATAKAKLVVSKSPLVQFSNNLEYLVQYPYGCVEQVTSSVFPQLYVQDLMRVISPNKQNINLLDTEIRENIQEGIMKLQSMQNYSGGLSYWQGTYNTSWFGTAYASHFMLEAQKAGYLVNQGVLNQMLDYLQNNSERRNTEDYYYYDERGKRRKKSIAPKEAVYSLYVLALGKRADISGMNYFKENPNLLALDSKYLLAISYLMQGDRAAYQELLPKAFEGEASENALSGSFYSHIRDEALALNALLEVDEGNIQIPSMARHLAEQVRTAKYLNTQENAFALMSLGKLAKKNNNQASGQVLANNAPFANYDGSTNLILNNGLFGKSLNIRSQGQGTLYYFWQTEGLSASGKVKEGDNKLKVRKTFYDQNGNVVKNNTFRQNDLVIVKVSIVAEPFFSEVNNVVLTDMLPAGLEIENPRLTPTKTINWIRTTDEPEYFDMRDDRINFFTSATGKVKNFYYLTRAVTIGTYTMGPVSADAMYNGEYYSYANSGTVRIVERRNEEN
jgi:alpha-2-macroglobulin